jgi:hypothetical protein
MTSQLPSIPVQRFEGVRGLRTDGSFPQALASGSLDRDTFRSLAARCHCYRRDSCNCSWN